MCAGASDEKRLQLTPVVEYLWIQAVDPDKSCSPYPIPVAETGSLKKSAKKASNK